jgi:hypothetical protein
VGGIVERELVSAQWQRIADSRTPQYRVNFDIVLGVTPAEERDSRKKRG